MDDRRAELPHGRPQAERGVTYDETLKLSPLPAFEHLSPADYALFLKEMVADIAAETRAMYEARGTRPLGVDVVQSRDPLDRPGAEVPSPAPLFLTASRERFHALRQAYREIVAKFLIASERFRAGERLTEFPEGTFPPALPALLAPASPRGLDP